MSDPKPQCMVCEQTYDVIPLLALNFQDKQYWICPSHLPVLIHRPDQLIGKLPGAEKLMPHDH